MTVVLLVRHGLCDPVGRWIAGRGAGVHLNTEGRAQAQELAGALGPAPVAAVYTSPLERARETAEPLAGAHRLVVRAAPGLTEIDYGDWTGRSLAELEGEPRWRDFNLRRAATRIPGGERMDEVIARASAALDEMARAHPDRLVAAVTHGDVIRGVLVHYLGTPVDHLLRLEVAPCSVSAVELTEHGARVLTINWRPGGPV